MNWPAKSACSAASLLFPIPGGPRQPPDRQFSYYSEPAGLASKVCWRSSTVFWTKDFTGLSQPTRDARDAPPWGTDKTLGFLSSDLRGSISKIDAGWRRQRKPNAGKPLPREWLWNPAIVTGLPIDAGRWLLPPHLSRLSRPADSLFGATHWAVAHAGRLLFLGGLGRFPAAGSSLAPI